MTTYYRVPPQPYRRPKSCSACDGAMVVRDVAVRDLPDPKAPPSAVVLACSAKQYLEDEHDVFNSLRGGHVRVALR